MRTLVGTPSDRVPITCVVSASSSLLLFARLAVGQTPDTSRRGPGAVVSGGVHDSVGRAPLAGALVQLVGADGLTRFSATATSDSLGRFALADIPDGRYMLGFLHPMLDSLGVEPPTRELTVAGHRTMRADLAIPSPARLRAAICGPTTAPDSGAVVVGVVRNARDGASVAGATVAGEWLEFTLGPQGIARRAPRLTATTGENGWFAVCNVPRGGAMTLAATRGADSTDRIEVQVPADGFLRRELYIGPARTVAAGDTTRRADSLAPPRRVRVGDGRLSGTVVAAAGGRPLAAAQVGIVDGPRTRANERGEWTLAGAPAGTRMLEVRAVGYYPERRSVNVVTDAPPVRAALSTFKAVLDTVRVAARYDANRSGFPERSRSGAGRYLRPDDIVRRQPIVTSDLFRTMAGVRLAPAADGMGEQLVMRGPFGSCSPAVYLNGRYFRDVTVSDLDAIVRPNEIAGIELYTDATAPAQFRALPTNPDRDSPCGSVVIWTR